MYVKLNNFEAVSSDKLKYYFNQQDFADLTLISGDKKIFPAHRIILSTGFLFLKILSENHGHSHPLIYLRGVRSEVLGPLSQLMYTGHSILSQHLVEEFMKTASDLEVDNLSCNMGKNGEQKTNEIAKFKTKKRDINNLN